MAAIGVHFGYSCACVAVFKDGRADVVANDAGDRVTPIVGIAAKQGRVRNAANTVVKVKQVLGRSFDDPETQTHKAETKCEVVNKGDKPFYKVQLEERTEHVAPQDVAKLIFHKMKETAQSALGSDVKEAVITVPFEFAHDQKRALREAAEAAGFHVLRLIHEPAAALLAYNIGQESHHGKSKRPSRSLHSHVLVYKLGGTSLSVTALQVSGGMYRVLHTLTDHSIGGERFTEALAQHLASETFKDVSENARAMLKLLNSADMAKHSLSSLGSANCFVDSLHDGMDFECNVSRARFELLCSSLFNKSIQPIRTLLEEAGLSSSDVNQVALCGGSARIPRLQQMIQDLFPRWRSSNSSPRIVIAVGAALSRAPGNRDPLELDLHTEDVDVSAPTSFLVLLLQEVDEAGGPVFSVLLPSGTPLPARRHHVLKGPGRLSGLCLELYQRLGSEQPEKLAKIVLRDLPPREEHHDIDTVVTMKRDGSVHVSCVEQSSGRSEALTIAAAS
uniref:Heat shock protein 14 n=1 Tax=Neogobius melanostomus TaxID=47308 RepID=A0A8C6WM92_9GOBI